MANGRENRWLEFLSKERVYSSIVEEYDDYRKIIEAGGEKEQALSTSSTMAETIARNECIYSTLKVAN